MTLLTVQKMNSHIQDLCTRFSVKLEINLGTLSTFTPKAVTTYVEDTKEVVGRTLRTVPIITEFVYAVSLHELGHLVAPNGSVVTSDQKLHDELVLYTEGVAWEWAERFALDWTAEMEAAKQHGLNSYRINHAWKKILTALESLSKDASTECAKSSSP